MSSGDTRRVKEQERSSVTRHTPASDMANLITPQREHMHIDTFSRRAV
jgi:hypothetical protein